MAGKEKEKENLHAGHRERLKEQFRIGGLEGFTDVQALELLLFYAIPRRDTNELAHKLLNRFGDFRSVMEAAAAELEEVEGIGENVSTLISLTTALNRRYFRAARKLGDKLENTDAVCDFVRDLFRYNTMEEVVMITLNSDRRVLGIHHLGVGGVTSVKLPVREICVIALREHAAGVVLTHNHLAEIAVPSKADIESTKRLFHALMLLGVELVDHVIVADDDAVSMRDSKCFQDF